jgi:hypothetical protein
MNIITQIEKYWADSVEADKNGDPEKAIKLNTYAILRTKTLLGFLENNDAVLNAHIFLKGQSSITRKPKKKI